MVACRSRSQQNSTQNTNYSTPGIAVWGPTSENWWNWSLVMEPQAHGQGQKDPQPLWFPVGTYHLSNGQAGGRSTGQDGSNHYSQPPVIEEDEKDSQRSTPVLGTSCQQGNPQPSQSSSRAKTRSKPETVTLTSLQRRVNKSKKLMEQIKATMEEAEDSHSAQTQYGVWLS